MRMNSLLRWFRLPLVLMMLVAWSATVHADQSPLMTAVLLPELIPSVVQQLVPMTVDVPQSGTSGSPNRIRISDAVYCGTDGHGGANAIGVASPADSRPVPRVLSASDCDGSLPAIAKRAMSASAAPAWVEAIKARISWAPWQLKAQVVDVATAGTGAPSLNGLPNLVTYPTSNLPILPPPGDNRRFDAAFSFPATGIVATLFPSGQASGAGVSKDQEWLSARIANAPRQANVLVDAQYAFINDLLKLYAPQYEVPIPIQGMAQTMTAKNVQVSGGDNTMTATGQLLMSDIAYNCAVHAAGDDLVIRKIELNPIAQACNSDDMLERMRCQGEQLASGGSSASVANALTNYYQGTPFHYSSEGHPLQFELGDRQFTATFEALKSSSKGTTISEAGRASIQGSGRR